MSTLTKVFVVLLVIFSIAFTSMTISIVAQTTNWKDTAQKYQEHARIADTNLRHEIAAGAALLATARDEVQAHLEKIGALETEVESASYEAAQLRSELAKAVSEKSGTEAMNRGLLAQLQMAETGREQFRGQRDDLERQNIDLQRRNIDLDDRVNELTARIDVLLEQKRQYEQQINILREENEKLAQQTRGQPPAPAFEEPSGAAMSDVEALSPVAARAIRGQVLDVSGSLVTISVGSADGVKKNMVFVIYRDDRYIGDVKINMVDPNKSAGRIMRSILSPAVGDQVADEGSLSASRG